MMKVQAFVIDVLTKVLTKVLWFEPRKTSVLYLIYLYLYLNTSIPKTDYLPPYTCVRAYARKGITT